MNKIITKEELIRARDDLINMSIESAPNQRKIFTGDIQIMLAGSEMIISENRKCSDKIRLLAYSENAILKDFVEKAMNYSCDNYLGALLYMLHQKTGCHFMFGYRMLNDNHHRWAENRKINESCYKDQELVDYIKINQIYALNQIKMSDAQEDGLIFNEVETCEFNSSYNFAGMTGFSKSLTNMAVERGFKTMNGFSSGPIPEDFLKTGSRFSDERIVAYA